MSDDDLRLQIRTLADAITDLQRKVDVLWRRSGLGDAAANQAPAPPAPIDPFIDVRKLIAGGRKIEAIKLYREITASGLKEAKDAVEALERGIGVPLRYQPPIGAPQPTPFSVPSEQHAGSGPGGARPF